MLASYDGSCDGSWASDNQAGATVIPLTAPRPETSSSSSDVAGYARALELLVTTVQELSLARNLERVMDIVKRAARAITGADGATFILRDGDCCYYADESAIAPLWKGRRFPMSICLGGWAMNHRQTITIENILGDERVPYEAYQPTFVKSLVMVPIRVLNPIGAIGSYWARPYRATDREVQLLQALADTTAVALENIRVHDHLEHLVEQRTSQLARANELLHREIAERQEIEAQLRAMSLTDNLTGINNQRGFSVLADQTLKAARRNGHRSLLLFLDCDGLKTINDSLGHDVGSAMLVDAAQVLIQTFREVDIVGRLGGDEFAILTAECEESTDAMRDRLLHNIERFNQNHQRPYQLAMSVGIVESMPDDHRSLSELIAIADEKMYVHKRARRSQQ